MVMEMQLEMGMKESEALLGKLVKKKAGLSQLRKMVEKGDLDCWAVVEEGKGEKWLGSHWKRGVTLKIT